MENEIELKFEVTPAAIQRLRRSRWFRTKGRAVEQKTIASVYFDTDNYKLRRNGLSLRVRQAPGKRVQTIKADGHATAGLFNRQEWECEIASDAPDWKAAQGTALEPLVTKKLKQAVKPIFETRVQRTVVPVVNGGAVIEITVDRGRVRTGRKSAAISELELELKEGDRAKLFELADSLAELTRATLGVKSKADRGYRLLGGPMLADIGVLLIDRQTKVQDAFKAIGFSCLKELACNEAAVRRGESGGVHHMRVGLRRLRAAMSLFSDILGDPQTEKVKTELKWLTGQLGRARDLDVFMSDGIDPADKATPGMKTLKHYLDEKRSEAFATARRAVESPRYRRLVLDTLKWLDGGEWLAHGGRLVAARRARAIEPYAEEILSRRATKVTKRLGKLEKLTPEKRHKTRIAVKKLRYAVEFLEGVFPDRKARKRCAAYRDALKALQDCLGRLNDIAVQERLAADVLQDSPRPKRRQAKGESAFAIGRVSGQVHCDFAPTLAAAVKAAKRFARTPPFWE